MRWRCPRTSAQALGIRSIATSRAHAGELIIAGDYEFFARPEWPALRKTYGLQFRAQRQMQPEFMYPAVAGGDVDVIAGYTSDGRIAHIRPGRARRPKQAIPPYDAILLISPRRAHDEKLIACAEPLVGAIDCRADARSELRRASKGNETPDAVARWLVGEITKKQD